MKKIVLWWRHDKSVRRQKQLNKVANEVINVMEWNGELYVSFHGVPLVKLNSIKGTVQDVLTDARETYKSFKYSNDD